MAATFPTSTLILQASWYPSHLAEVTSKQKQQKKGKQNKMKTSTFPHFNLPCAFVVNLTMTVPKQLRKWRKLDHHIDLKKRGRLRKQTNK